MRKIKTKVIATFLITFSITSIVFASSDEKKEEMIISKIDSLTPIIGSNDNFTGSVKVQPLFTSNLPARANGAYVYFECGAHSAWHSHPLGQTLIVTQGSGLIQEWGGKLKKIEKGDVIWTPPNVKHWHGAGAKIKMTHLSIVESLNGISVKWFEKVSKQEYNAPISKRK